MWDLGCTKWQWARFFSEYLGFPLLLPLYRCSMIISISYCPLEGQAEEPGYLHSKGNNFPEIRNTGNKSAFIVRSSAFQILTEHITWVTAVHILCDRAVTVSADVACTHALTPKLITLDTCFMLWIMAETKTYCLPVHAAHSSSQQGQRLS